MSIRLSQEQMNVAIKSLPHLVEWLEKTGRTWFVLNGLDLVTALWQFDELVPPQEGQPGAVEIFMQCLMLYREHRGKLPAGRTKTEKNVAGDEVEVPVTKGETLERDEIDRCIRYLVGQITEMDPTWKLENPAL